MRLASRGCFRMDLFIRAVEPAFQPAAFSAPALILERGSFRLWLDLIMNNITSLVVAVLLGAVVAGRPVNAGAEGFSGKVTETLDAGGYTYVAVDTGTNQTWAAAPEFTVKAGDLVTVPDSMPMSNFHSQSLNRDFPVIYFAGSITVQGANSSAAKLPADHPAVGGAVGGDLPAGHPAIPARPALPKVDVSGIKPASGGKTVAEIFAASATLAGKSVKVRGKVVKYNPGIMGKNWVHIQDGTGSAGSNDLLVTTTDPAKRGDTVLVEGKVAVNQDFGANYKYSVLLEEARVTAE
jgi:membrane protein implicated in regulation of membrane protease activity